MAGGETGGFVDHESGRAKPFSEGHRTIVAVLFANQDMAGQYFLIGGPFRDVSEEEYQAFRDLYK